MLEFVRTFCWYILDADERQARQAPAAASRAWAADCARNICSLHVRLEGIILHKSAGHKNILKIEIILKQNKMFQGKQKYSRDKNCSETNKSIPK